jgi:hypothetical protein
MSIVDRILVLLVLVTGIVVHLLWVMGFFQSAIL